MYSAEVAYCPGYLTYHACPPDKARPHMPMSGVYRKGEVATGKLACLAISNGFSFLVQIPPRSKRHASLEMKGAILDSSCAFP